MIWFALGQCPDDLSSDIADHALLGNIIHPIPHLGPRYLFDVGAKAEVLVDPHLRIQRYVLRQVADVAPERNGILVEVHARHHHPSGGRWQKRREHAHHRGLTGPVGSEEAEHLPFRDEEAQVADYRLFHICFSEIFNFDH